MMSGQEVAVLVIEDEPEIRRFLRTTLPAHGFRLYEVATGREGLTEAKARNPNLILIDLGLPDLDGNEVIRQCGNGPLRQSLYCRPAIRNRQKSRRSTMVRMTM